MRYWDLRETLSQEVVGVSFEQTAAGADFVLPSDCRLRQDSIQLKEGNIEAAQEVKNQMEARQREDAALRKAAQQRRAQQGAKIVYRYN